MKGYYWLLIIYGVTIVGFSQMVIDNVTSPYTIYSLIGWLAIPTLVYFVIRNRKQKKLQAQI